MCTTAERLRIQLFQLALLDQKLSNETVGN